jgi:hypothetical protein
MGIMLMWLLLPGIWASPATAAIMLILLQLLLQLRLLLWLLLLWLLLGCSCCLMPLRGCCRRCSWL